MAEIIFQKETIDNIADSIRTVSSESAAMSPDEMAAYILANLVKPTTRQAAKTYTPSTSNQTIPAGTFLTGAATIQGDADLTAANIKKGVNIFGKTGTLSGAWGDASIFNGITKVSSGSFTIANFNAANNISYTFTHDLNADPKIFILVLGKGSEYNIGTTSSSKSGLGFLYQAKLADDIIGKAYIGIDGNGNRKASGTGLQHSGTGASMGSSGVNISSTSSTITITPYYGSSVIQFYYPVPYYWIALA